MDINEQNQPDCTAVPEQPAAEGLLGQAEPQLVPEAPAEEPAPVACRIPEVEAPIEPEPAEDDAAEGAAPRDKLGRKLSC